SVVPSDRSQYARCSSSNTIKLPLNATSGTPAADAVATIDGCPSASAFGSASRISSVSRIIRRPHTTASGPQADANAYRDAHHAPMPPRLPLATTSPYDPRHEEDARRMEEPTRPSEQEAIDEADVRAALAPPHDDETGPQPQEIAEITTEPGWLSVTLAIDTPSRDLFRRTYARLAAAFPE